MMGDGFYFILLYPPVSMPKGGGSLTLAEKYELLRKKQAEKVISKPSKTPSSSLDANKQLLEILAAKQAEDKVKSEFKLPASLQRALKEDPEIFKKQEAQTTLQKETISNESDPLLSSNPLPRDDEDDQFFVKRNRPRTEREYSSSSSNRTFTDEQGMYYIHSISIHTCSSNSVFIFISPHF